MADGGWTSVSQAGQQGESANAAREVWVLGDLRVDVGQRQVTRGEQEIELPKLSFDLLLALARAAPNVLSQSELMDRVWPGLVVGAETVVQRIKLLRTALGDDPEAPRYIRGLRGQGYKLIVPAIVESGAPPQPEATVEAAPVATAARPTSRVRFVTRGLLGAAVFGGLVYVLVTPLARERQRPVVEARPVLATSADQLAHTVAVLPFDTLGATASTDAGLARALPEVVLDRLALVPGLNVVARESSFALAGAATNSRDTGTRLQSRFLVEGSVQQQGDALRVTARLIDSDTDRQVWSGRYDSRQSDLFTLQDAIAGGVAQALESQLGTLASPPVKMVSPRRIDAYLAYLKGRSLLGRYTIAAAEAAAVELERATQLDPDFADAHAALYDARMQAAGLQLDDLSAARARYRPSLERAVSLDPKSGAVDLARAMWDDLDNTTREAVFRRAIAADPASSRALTAFSEFLDITDGTSDQARVRGSGFFPRAGSGPARVVRDGSARAVEATQLLERAVQRDPLSPRPRFRQIQRSFDTSGSVDEKMQALLALDPDYYPALQRVAKYRWLRHESPSESIALIERAITADPRNPWARQTAVAFYLDIGDVAAARDVAQGATASQATAAPVLLLAQGDAKAAARAAATDASYVFGFNESWGSSESIRDAALLTRDYAGAEDLLMKRYDMQRDAPYRVTVRNFRNYVHLAHLEQLQGRPEQARGMLEAVMAWIDVNPRFGPVYFGRTRAEAELLLGHTDRALAALRDAFERDHDYTEWWYTLQRNPVWNALHENREFQALVKLANQFAAREGQRVAELRKRGDIPARPVAGG